jgi:hypothetical protein
LSALAGDGALVLCCHPAGFTRPGRDVLRYQESLSANRTGARQQVVLAQNLVLARDSSLPVRLVIMKPASDASRGTVGVRPDLVGKVTAFDGDAFTVDFSRLEEPEPKVKAKVKPRRKR